MANPYGADFFRSKLAIKMQLIFGHIKYSANNIALVKTDIGENMTNKSDCVLFTAYQLLHNLLISIWKLSRCKLMF